jgi:MTH538 TIR-like domain (DUF1863)
VPCVFVLLRFAIGAGRHAQRRDGGRQAAVGIRPRGALDARPPHASIATGMAYRNKTYVVFDGDEDRWAYAYMKGWRSNENMDFNFYDAHELASLRDGSSEATVKQGLRERMKSAKQVVVLLGKSTKNLYRFVRWELELALAMDLPIVVVNLNNTRKQDADRCPPILWDTYAVHIAFKAAIIQNALDNFPDEFAARASDAAGPRVYKSDIYTKLGL